MGRFFGGGESRKQKYFILVSILGLIVRCIGIQYISADARDYLLPWFYTIKEAGGMSALAQQVGNYNIPYQCLIALMSYLPFEPLFMYKALSIIFDYVLALVAAKLVCLLRNDKKMFIVVYATVLLWPTHIMNSSVWAQCDSIYVAFVIISLLYLYKGNNKKAFCYIGISFAFKLQTIFIFPFYICYYCFKRFSVYNFLLVLISGYILCIPGFLYGRDLLEPLTIYFSQTDQYHAMWLNFPSMWKVVGIDNYNMLSPVAIGFSGLVLFIGLWIEIKQKIKLDESINYLLWAIWSVWSCLLFLPAMHERYGYLLDVLLIILVFLTSRLHIFVIAPWVSSIVTYSCYLFGVIIHLRIWAILYTVSYLCFIYYVIKQTKSNDKCVDIA